MRLQTAALSLFVLASSSGALVAQNGQTDSRLFPYLGCWASDTRGAATPRAGLLTCVVPVSGSPDVDMVSIVDGKILSHRRIDASTRAHPIEGQGCRGQEKTSWSSLMRRVYLRSEYICASTGIAGGSATLFSFLPTGDWLEVEDVRSGGGSVIRIERRRDAGVPNNLPREIAGQIGTQRLAVVTARAEASAPIRTDDILEALRATDTAVVRVWLGETAQHFTLTGEEFATLTRAEVPPSVLQAMMATPPKYQLGVGVDANGRSTDEYLSTPGWAPLYPYPYPYLYPYYTTYGCCYPYPAPYYYPVATYASYNYYYPAEPAYTTYHPYGYSYYNPYLYLPSSFNRINFPTARPVVNAFRPSFLTNPVGVHATGGSQVHVMGRSPGPVGRRP